MFCAGYNPYFFVMLSLLNSDDFSVMAFFLQLHFMLVTALLRLILSFIFHDISLKSQELSALFFVTFQWILFCLIFFVELSLLAILLVSLIYSFIYSLLFVYLFVYFFILAFSFRYLFIILSSCLAAIIYLFISYSLFFVKLC